MKFMIEGGGDLSVGLNAIESEIIINDNFTWDKEMIEDFKKVILEFYDVTGARAYTENEYNQILKYENEK